jgi:pantothenate kinase type III
MSDTNAISQVLIYKSTYLVLELAMRTKKQGQERFAVYVGKGKATTIPEFIKLKSVFHFNRIVPKRSVFLCFLSGKCRTS